MEWRAIAATAKRPAVAGRPGIAGKRERRILGMRNLPSKERESTAVGVGPCESV
jgi:hypothetical protein